MEKDRRTEFRKSFDRKNKKNFFFANNLERKQPNFWLIFCYQPIFNLKTTNISFRQRVCNTYLYSLAGIFSHRYQRHKLEISRWVSTKSSNLMRGVIKIYAVLNSFFFIKHTHFFHFVSSDRALIYTR